MKYSVSLLMHTILIRIQKSKTMKDINESDLFEPVKDYLAAQGYNVKAEVRNCDITAVKDDELVIVELKKSLNISLLIQAANRQKFADTVYVAVAAKPDGPRPRNFKGACHLLKRLELGLILVTFLKTRTKVEILFHPSEFKKRKNPKIRRNIIREISGRTGNFNTGGTTGKQIITAYRESAIHIACCLMAYDELSPAKLRQFGTSKKTQNILCDNHYGWFERVKRGVYRLHPQGKKALAQYSDLVDHYKTMVDNQKMQKEPNACAQ